METLRGTPSAVIGAYYLMRNKAPIYRDISYVRLQLPDSLTRAYIYRQRPWWSQAEVHLRSEYNSREMHVEMHVLA